MTPLTEVLHGKADTALFLVDGHDDALDRKFSGANIALAQVQEALAYAFRSEGAPWCLAPGQSGFHLVTLGVDGLESGVLRGSSTSPWPGFRKRNIRSVAGGINNGFDIHFLLKRANKE